MKNILKIAFALFAAAILGACETYVVDDPDTTAVYPLDGRYVCFMYDHAAYTANAATANPIEQVDVRVSNTTNNDTDKVWVYVINYCKWRKLKNVWATECVTFKADCNVGQKTITATNVTTVTPPNQLKNVVAGGATNSSDARAAALGDAAITAGKTVSATATITLDGYDTPTGYKADALDMDYTFNGVKYKIIGHRYTGWEEDYDAYNAFIVSYMGW